MVDARGHISNWMLLIGNQVKKEKDFVMALTDSCFIMEIILPAIVSPNVFSVFSALYLWCLMRSKVN